MEKFRYWYEPSKQYGYELISYRIFSFHSEEKNKTVYKAYVDVFLEPSKFKKMKNRHCSSVEGFLDEEFRRERSTGLKDLNGQEIFENDIIQIVYETWNGGEYQEKEIVGVLKYGDPCDFHSFDEWYLENDDDIYSMNAFESLIIGDDISVLGNINENPELVKKYKLEVSPL